jgi:diacylglycerol kinase family enzyme
VVVLKDSGSLKMIDELARMKSGNYQGEGDIIYIQAKSATVRSKERDVSVTVDGEPVGILPAVFRIQKRALNIVV